MFARYRRTCEGSAVLSSGSTSPKAPSAPGSTAPVDADAAAVTTQTAGRGGMVIGLAKISFILFGFGQQLALPAILQRSGYGSIGTVLAVVGIVNNVIVAGSIQGVSRVVSSAPESDKQLAFGRVLRMHLGLAFAVGLVFAAIAPWLARFVSRPDLTMHIRITSAVAFLYAVYAPLVGGLNGQRRFVAQAGLDIFYGAMRFVTTVGAAYVFARILGRDGVMGGVTGFCLSAAIIVPLALTRSGMGKPGGTTPSARSYFGFIGPVLIGAAGVALLLQTDFLLFSRFAGQAAARMGMADDASSELVAVYRALQLFSFLPYQLLMGVTFVLFPMLAKARADGDQAAIRSYTRTGVRLAFLLVGLIAGIVAALPYPLLRFAYQDRAYADLGAHPQVLHVMAMASMALLGVVSTALTSLGRERVAALITLAAVAMVGAACWVWVPGAAFGEPMMFRSATATLIAMTLAAIVGAVVLWRTAGGFVAPLTPLRVGLALAAVTMLGTRIPFFGRLVTAPLGACVVAGLYLLILVATGELGRADLDSLNTVLRRRRGGAKPAA